mmetsp:Transcript_40028/g.96661  ORF Transcript_40028/g.96661 Transcript_40028/m.96661 type:complete len:194 (-) Transcript_40028:128-709(-)|eukprot:CAMPEP_0113459470 /NCGR_PEP_ID=MMETSP0014_2-20120614/10469_1 /TAXON_ID=2857 /ORGANISM="Nitzschia sp." /LENGTH=193 /DNA_ID=CAMNT_0000351055 /DNA_START=204 /DNA_END=785 /DNA_ORIENTATION=- /assembly_acc=CAM_ASM_000159
MDQLLQFAEQAGMSEEQGKTATGGIFGLLQNGLGEEQYGKLKAEFPEADQLATSQQQTSSNKNEAGGGGMGGLMGSAMGALSGGGGAGSGSSATDITALLAKLAGNGITPQQIQQFLPLAAPYIQQMTGVDVSSMLGVSPSGSGSTGGGGGNSAMGMLSSLTGSGGSGGGGGGGTSAGDSSNPLGSVMGMFGK